TPSSPPARVRSRRPRPLPSHAAYVSRDDGDGGPPNPRRGVARTPWRWTVGPPNIERMAASTSPVTTGFLSPGAPDATALSVPDGSLTYAVLRAAVAARRDELALGGRSVVVLSGRNCVDWVVTYLALLDGGQVPLLASGDPDRLV